mmetsp:Transcript_1158/g.2991  ORF Transcript_1158/g.2991 Transcript_1158/m.2991 type:complete len:89 (+) Transcript_1158:625-891(+)
MLWDTVVGHVLRHKVLSASALCTVPVYIERDGPMALVSAGAASFSSRLEMATESGLSRPGKRAGSLFLHTQTMRHVSKDTSLQIDILL